MSMKNRDTDKYGHVIPFERPNSHKDQVTTSSIAAVIAVTVLHYEDESPEARLLEIIESSGEAEVFDLIDELDQINMTPHKQSKENLAVNDNKKLIPV